MAERVVVALSAELIVPAPRETQPSDRIEGSEKTTRAIWAILISNEGDKAAGQCLAHIVLRATPGLRWATVDGSPSTRPWEQLPMTPFDLRIPARDGSSYPAEYLTLELENLPSVGYWRSYVYVEIKLENVGDALVAPSRLAFGSDDLPNGEREVVADQEWTFVKV